MRKTPRLGQHFLRNTSVATRLAQAARCGPKDTVLEIGPGHGVLTRELLASGARVIAIEKDSALVNELRTTFESEIANKQLDLVADDVRNFRPESWQLTAGGYILAANIPYYITGEILRQFLSSKNPPRTVAVLVQKEVADRIVARDNKESILSISVKAYGKPRIEMRVARGNFSPPPSVDSAVLVIENISQSFFEDVDEKTFFKIVRAGFGAKRKFLSSNLKKFGFTKPEFDACGIDNKARAEDLSLHDWKCLVQQLPDVSDQMSE